MYNVLWIDDEHLDADMVQFAIEADSHGLNLEGYTSYEEGFKQLERNLEHFDIILLDGLFLEKQNQSQGTEDESGLGMSIAKINELKTKKVFPWFILSGKESFTKEANTLLKANKVRCFDKTNPADVIKLFEEMRIAGSGVKDAQLKYKFRNLLEVCSESYLGETQISRLFSLIKHVENLEVLNGTEDMLNTIRKIVERIFYRLGEIEIIPKLIIDNKGWINGSSLFLSNKHSDYEHKVEIVPPIVSENFYRLLNIIQDGSHGEGELKLKVDKYLKESQSDYLFKSCVFLLFDLLMWFMEYVDNHGDKDRNRSMWKCTKVWTSGEVIRISENGWGTFQAYGSKITLGIPPKMMSDKALSVKDQIKVITEPGPEGKTYIKSISMEV